MKQSKVFIPTSKSVKVEDATCKSLQLMLKAGMVKQVAAGVYTYLPLAYNVLNKIEKVVREELDAIECSEMLMPAIQPRELWEESGRWSKYGKELMRLNDRHNREFCLGPTHEEVITTTIRDHIKSYRQLPLSLFQIQTKFRDELRPRFGLMRGREFIMKDGYSFHTSFEELDTHYDEMAQAYENIFNRCGLDIIKVEADSGAIGGSNSTEFMSISEIGEDTLVYCKECHYQANLEKAVAAYDKVEINEEVKDIELLHTPGVWSIEDIAKFVDLPTSRTVKYITYIDDIENKYYLVACPGDYEINETKVTNLVNAKNLRMLTEEEIKEQKLVKGYMGTYNLETTDKFIIVVDDSIPDLINHTAGANQFDYHYINVNYGRDYKADFIGDIKEVRAGNKCSCNADLSFAKGIEVGHIFKLGTVYSEALKANYIGQDQKEYPMVMGCYGIGISRVLMAVVEAIATDRGLIWPKDLQPYDLHIIIVDNKKEEQVELANKIYDHYKKQGFNVLIDDRFERAGSKFADADLIGVSKRIIVGKNAIENKVEYLDRYTDNKVDISYEDSLNIL